MQQCHSIQGLGITRLRNLLTNYTSVNLYIITKFDKMNKTNKVRKGEVRIYGGMTYVAVPEIKSDPDQKKFCFKGYYYVEVKEQDDKELSGLMGRVVYE